MKRTTPRVGLVTGFQINLKLALKKLALVLMGILFSGEIFVQDQLAYPVLSQNHSHTRMYFCLKKSYRAAQSEIPNYLGL